MEKCFLISQFRFGRIYIKVKKDSILNFKKKNTYFTTYKIVITTVHL